MQASYETTSVGSQTEYQPMDTRGNKNLSYSSIMAEYVSLTITRDLADAESGIPGRKKMGSDACLS